MTTIPTFTKEQAVEALDTIPVWEKPRVFWARLAKRLVDLGLFAEASDAMSKAATVSPSVALRDSALALAALYDRMPKV